MIERSFYINGMQTQIIVVDLFLLFSAFWTALVALLFATWEFNRFGFQWTPIRFMRSVLPAGFGDVFA